MTTQIRNDALEHAIMVAQAQVAFALPQDLEVLYRKNVIAQVANGLLSIDELNLGSHQRKVVEGRVREYRNA